jgi:conserved oligomeric Golgi complex subunit 6
MGLFDQARVLQTVRSQESSIIAYKITNLLQFYGVTMRRTIGDEAVLSKTLQEYEILTLSVARHH